MKISSKVWSFDVFDTVLTRIYAQPADLFHDLGEKIGNDPGSFTIKRIAAWEEAKKRLEREDVPLEAVYEVLSEWAGWNKDQASAIMGGEIELERRAVRPAPAVLDRIRLARAKGCRILFISDTCYSSFVIKSLLEIHGAYQPGDAVYTSSEWGMSKATGGLFRLVVEKEGIDPSQITHFGNDPVYDVRAAARWGIQTAPLPDGNLTKYEKILCRTETLPRRMRSLFAGACRRTRLECPQKEKSARVIWNTAADVIGPVLIGYVAWILAQAKSRGFKRLYFLSRDGQILFRIAQVLKERLGWDVECRYLYGSRQAWHLPALFEIGDYERTWICESTRFLSVRSFLARIGLGPDECAQELNHCGLAERDWDRNLLSRERQKLKDLLKTKTVTDMVCDRAESQRKLALGYFKQEGLFDDIPWALVDVGWHGRLQRSLGEIFRLGGKCRSTHGFYFGLVESQRTHPFDSFTAYFCMENGPKENTEIVLKTAALMEIFTAADHGGVVGYAQRNGRIEPLLREPRNKAAVSWGLEVQQEAVLTLAGQIPEDALVREKAFQGMVDVTRELLNAFHARPSREEAAVYGGFKFSEDQNEAVFVWIANPLGIASFLRYLMGRSPLHHCHQWLGASIHLSPFWARWLFRLIARSA